MDNDDELRTVAAVDLGSNSFHVALACLDRFGQRIRNLPHGDVRIVGTNTLGVAHGRAMREGRRLVVDIGGGREFFDDGVITEKHMDAAIQGNHLLLPVTPPLVAFLHHAEGAGLPAHQRLSRRLVRVGRPALYCQTTGWNCEGSCPAMYS